MKCWMPLLSSVAAITLGCASTAESERLTASTPLVDPEIERVARELVRAAELRADPAPMRVVLVADSTMDASRNWGRTLTPSDAGPLCEEIVDELELVLSPELNLLDADWSQEARPTEEDPLRIAEALGATHVLVAGLTPRAESLRLALRLIETRSHLIVATSQGRLTLDIWTGLLDQHRAQAEHARLADAASTDADLLAAKNTESAAPELEPAVEVSLDETALGVDALDPTAPAPAAPESTIAQRQPVPAGAGASSTTEYDPIPERGGEPLPPGPAALRLRAMGRQLLKSTNEQ